MTFQAPLPAHVAAPSTLDVDIGSLTALALHTQPLPALYPVPVLLQALVSGSGSAVAALIDHTLLAPSSSLSAIDAVCADAVACGAKTVCVNSSVVSHAVQALKGSAVSPIAVVGFPFGAGNTAGKVAETVQAVKDGAKEIDMVQNIGLLKSGLYAAVWADIASVVHAAAGSPVKVILETAQLTPLEIAISSYIAVGAGARFLKTSTGYGGCGAKAEDVRLMYEIAQRYGNGKVEVKASGGIRSFETVKTMVAHGATRVGASGTKAIVAEANGGEASQLAAAGSY
ncbi:deoxyribose-phosphate aldolase [Tilletiaria anomala UBC 951]|uniref:deoxyribose-phosphate aldolase n=1 Tax=Tilletiaria anomala (strain ATCC 24038 / CBS 436.72 / UBC 951) TaxID=1037660 RepID=A0A066W8L9_TILAU|nr:deoxyribose-phosphate aldolase [Tilletiaria anomala UBC 951]KDN47135.1 deoxyribose-phosphate aldolase [Tilletiaria anomala UBC 951]